MTSLRLWLRAGSDGARLGGDPLGHHLFMLLLLKEQHDPELKFEVRTVNESKAPPEFKQAGLRKPPAIAYDDEVYVHEDDIVELLDRWPPRRTLHEAEDVTADLFRHFAFFIKEVNKDPKALTGELLRIDRYLSEAGTAFLCGDSVSHLDALILPRLHCIRIAAKALKDFDIPADLKHLWAYMKNGYELDLFKKSCPSDQEIVLYWSDRPDTPSISSQRRAQLYRQKSEYSRGVPSEV